ncbi:proteasome-associated protein ECM29-like protein isoform X1 [Cucumis melo var. makuwa]|uniref:Proteasome-associated protein ECM29-like protein isoform X1 n=1 Tax=Cucumis melo var. makuwa TaxID=1194695 RepID=A0A5D3BAR6_CUCMM|nr:proteasome-associated protein ECM29-like protein isoform X1 [Cucumis melo var. makuwa]
MMKLHSYLKVNELTGGASLASMLHHLTHAIDVVNKGILLVSVQVPPRFEDDKHVSRLFEELWEENTSGERITLQLYLGEIVSLICDEVTSSSWSSKKKSAQAIMSRLCEVLGESISSYHQVLHQSLMKEVSGHIWEGKETILDALGAISTTCHKLISTADPAMPNAIVNLISSFCSKKAKKFQEAAFACLEKVHTVSSNRVPDISIKLLGKNIIHHLPQETIIIQPRNPSRHRHVSSRHCCISSRCRPICPSIVARSTDPTTIPSIAPSSASIVSRADPCPFVDRQAERSPSSLRVLCNFTSLAASIIMCPTIEVPSSLRRRSPLTQAELSTVAGQVGTPKPTGCVKRVAKLRLSSAVTDQTSRI